MDHIRPTRPFTYSSQLQLQLDNLSTARQPLSNLAGNAQPHTLPLVNLHHDHKDSRPGSDRTLRSAPTVPSQPQWRNIGSALDLRRQSIRKGRHLKFSRNPIVDSPQYKAYRERQTREEDLKDAKWPNVLEDAFLDALIELPQMQRRKYSYHGKPHGRNELITEYLWIAYKQSLPPGAPLDESMRRTRKQVSSHIQVLKAFLREHPAYDLLFPKARGPKNGFQDSFKDDPCLKALSEGRLPGKRSHCSQIKPVIFWLVLKADADDQGQELYIDEEGLHDFSKLLPQPRSRRSLESICYWRDRFPLLHQLQAQDTLNCPIIHMDVSLNLLSSPPTRSSQLLSRTVLSIPGKESPDCKWKIVTTLNKPQDLCSNVSEGSRLRNPLMNQAAFFVEVSSSSDRETLINVPFPAAQFADVFAHLVGMQGQYEDQTKSQTCSRGSDPLDRPAREYVEQLSMYQELQSEGEPGASFVTRAVFIWTFHEARKGESNHTTWGYLDLAPPRRAIMSPPPHPSHQVSSTINENYCCWAETPLLMQPTSVVDPPCRQGLATPPHTADFQSPFPANEYSFLQQTFEMPDENLSFISNMTLESGSTLVDVTTADIESFMSNAHSQLTDFEHSASNWQFTACEGFEPDPDWATYGIPSHAPIVAWETETKLKGWPELELQDVKQLDWMDDTNSKHQHEWESNQMKQIINLTEQNVGQKPMAWMNEHHNSLEEDIKVDFEPVVNLRTGMNIALHRNEAPNLSVESMDSYKKEADWHSTVDDVFHYAQLTKLKA